MNDIDLKAQLKGASLSESHGIISDYIQQVFGTRIPELLEDALVAAETTTEYLKVVEKIQDLIRMPKVGTDADNKQAEAMQLSASVLVALTSGLAKMTGVNVDEQSLIRMAEGQQTIRIDEEGESGVRVQAQVISDETYESDLMNETGYSDAEEEGYDGEPNWAEMYEEG
jgi:capsule polysaccharide export protein KpsC/LpsZ